MKNSFSAIVHCEMAMERVGLVQMAQNLPFRLDLNFTNLSASGIQLKLRKNPDLIILNSAVADVNITLPQKIKLFAPHIPLLMLIPKSPDSYIYFLRSVMVDRILQKPFHETDFQIAVRQLISH